MRYSAEEYMLLTDGGEPENFTDAMEDENMQEQIQAMREEITSANY